jgi:hypothetical protein
MALFATDLDHLIELGYTEQESLWALKTTKGDKAAAVTLLKHMMLDPDSAKKKLSWYGEAEDDWVNYIETVNNASEEIRGLFKCPVYIRVASFRKDDLNNILFKFAVSMKDGRVWSVEQHFNKISSFKGSLPMRFVNKLPHFPFPRLLSRENDSEFQERRRVVLEEWFRDMCLNEECMTNAEFMSAVYAFIEVDKHGGIYKTGNATTGNAAAGLERPYLCGPLFTVDFKSIVGQLSGPYPVDVNSLLHLLPVKVKIDSQLKQVIEPPPTPVNTVGGGTGVASSGADSSLKQLEKDYSRDRVVIQGRRLLGSRTNIDGLCRQIKSAIHFQMQNNKISQMLGNDGINKFALKILSSIGRTESAFSTFALINHIISAPGCMVTPESALASPIEIMFSVKPRPTSKAEQAKIVNIDAAYREFLTRDETISDAVAIDKLQIGSSSSSSSNLGGGGGEIDIEAPLHTLLDDSADTLGASATMSKRDSMPLYTPVTPDINLYHVTQAHPDGMDWCILCEAQAITVFRIVDAETMKPVLQVRVSFRKVLFGLPMLTSFGGSVNVNDVMIPKRSKLNWDLNLKEGESSIVIQQYLQTTSHDWSRDE